MEGRADVDLPEGVRPERLAGVEDPDEEAESSQHPRYDGFGTAEDQQFGGTHFHSHLFRFSAVVGQRKRVTSLVAEYS